MKKIKDSIIDTFEVIENAYLFACNQKEFIKTGIAELDYLFKDTKEEALITIGAKPGTRLPSFWLNLVEAFCVQNKTCLYLYGWGLETEFTTNLMCMLSGVEKHKVISGILGSTDWENLAECANKIQNWKLFIGNSSDFEISIIEELIKKQKTDYVFIDSIEFLRTKQDWRFVVYRLKEICVKYHTTIFISSDAIVADSKPSGILSELSDKIIFLEYDKNKKGKKCIKATSIKPSENFINLEFELSGKLITYKSKIDISE